MRPPAIRMDDSSEDDAPADVRKEANARSSSLAHGYCALGSAEFHCLAGDSDQEVGRHQPVSRSSQPREPAADVVRSPRAAQRLTTALEFSGQKPADRVARAAARPVCPGSARAASVHGAEARGRALRPQPPSSPRRAASVRAGAGSSAEFDTTRPWASETLALLEDSWRARLSGVPKAKDQAFRQKLGRIQRPSAARPMTSS